MAEYLHPGIFVENKNFTNPVISGGATSTGAFVGITPRGEVGVPTFITSWTDFVNQFALGTDSPYLKNAYLSYELYGFFLNGGQRAWVVRATDGTETTASIELANGSAPISFTAKDPGVWGNKLQVKITTNVDNIALYDVTVSKAGNTLEVFPKLGLADTAEYNFVGYINQNSKYIKVDSDATTIAPASLNVVSSFTGGADGTTAITPQHSIDAMKKFDSVESINLLVLAETQADTAVSEGLAYAEKRRAFFVYDGDLNADFTTIQTFKKTFSSDGGGLYFPWVQISDPIGTVSKTKFVPSSGYVAGEIARTDTERGVFKAPAGTQAVLKGVIGLKTVINDDQQDILNPKAINVIRAFADTGIVVWGAKTSAGNYINVIREVNFVKASIFNSTKWAVFEPNGPDLWRRLKNNIDSFLRGRYKLGAYAGDTEAKAFFVKCDSELNTQDEINAGRVNTDVGVAVNKPGEFIIFRVGQWEGGGAVQ